MKKITLAMTCLMVFAMMGVANAQISTFPYNESFEAGDGGWASDGGANDTWALGAPANTVINSASDGANAWVTNLTGLYSAGQFSAVESPVFDFSALVNDPQISMDIWWESEFSWDGARLETTIDGGGTWQQVGAAGDPDNWYTDTSINGLGGGTQEGWTGRNGTGATGGSNGWVEAVHKLDGLAGEAAVQIRVLFGSDGSVTDEGFAFDNVEVRSCEPQLNCQDATVSLDANGMLMAPYADLVSGAVIEATANGTLTAPFDATDLPIDIIDNGNVTSVLNVSGLGGQVGLDYVPIVTIDISHNWDTDLDISLIAPSGETIDLSSDNGGTADNYTNTVFQDGAPSITTGSAPFTGTFQAEQGAFADILNGADVNGNWTLSVTDDEAGIAGTVNSFSITFEELDIDVLAPDGCGGGTLITFDPPMLDCTNIGDNTITMTTMVNGVPVSCTATMTVLAGVNYTALPFDIFTGTGAAGGACEANVNYDIAAEIAGCDGDATLVLTSGFASGDAFPVGTTTVTYDVTDDAGTVLDTYSFDVTITDTSEPIIDCPDDFAVSPDDTGMFTIPDWTTLASDNCSAGADLVTTQSPAAGEVVADGSTTEVTITATDAAGNITECVFSFTVDATLGINDLSLDSGLSVYPNPTTGVFTLANRSGADLETMTITDVNGRTVAVFDLSEMSAEKQISIADLATGVYFAQISTKSATSVKRIVKQ